MNIIENHREEPQGKGKSKIRGISIRYEKIIWYVFQ